MRTSDITAGEWYQLKEDNAYGLGPIYLKVQYLTFTEGYKTPWLKCVKTLTEEPMGSFRPSDFSRNYNDVRSGRR